MFENNEMVLGLTGTLSSSTETMLRQELDLKVLVRYSIEQAVDEGIIPDYEITVIQVPLDNKIKNNYKGKFKTEKQRFDNLMWVVNKQEEEDEPSFMMKLKIIDLLMNSISRTDKTKQLIQEYFNERILVFCGRTEIADNLGIPSYHSKSTEKNNFNDFMNGTIPHLAVVKIGSTGTTFLPLSRVIINYTSSSSEDLTQKLNRALSFEYDNLSKKGLITILSSTEKIEKDWIKSSLSMLDPKKIRYL